MNHARINVFRKILYGLLAIHVLVEALMLYIVVVLDDPSVFGLTIGIAVSIFYVVLLITLVNGVDYLAQRLDGLLDRLIRLENEVHPDKVITPGTTALSESRSSLSRRLGNL